MKTSELPHLCLCNNVSENRHKVGYLALCEVVYHRVERVDCNFLLKR